MLENFQEIIEKCISGDLAGEFIVDDGEVLIGITRKDVSTDSQKLYNIDNRIFNETGEEVSPYGTRRVTRGPSIEKFIPFSELKGYSYVKVTGDRYSHGGTLIKMVGPHAWGSAWTRSGCNFIFYNVVEILDYKREIEQNDEFGDYQLNYREVYSKEHPYKAMIHCGSAGFFNIIDEKEYKAIVGRLQDETKVDVIMPPTSSYCKYILDKKKSTKEKQVYYPNRGTFKIKELVYDEKLELYVAKDPTPIETVKPIVVRVNKSKYKKEGFTYDAERSDLTKTVYRRVWSEQIGKKDEETGYSKISEEKRGFGYY